MCLKQHFLASCNFCSLIISFANSFNPDKDRRSVGPDLDPYVRNQNVLPEGIQLRRFLFLFFFVLFFG